MLVKFGEIWPNFDETLTNRARKAARQCARAEAVARGMANKRGARFKVAPSCERRHFFPLARLYYFAPAGHSLARSPPSGRRLSLSIRLKSQPAERAAKLVARAEYKSISIPEFVPIAAKQRPAERAAFLLLALKLVASCRSLTPVASLQSPPASRHQCGPRGALQLAVCS